VDESSGTLWFDSTSVSWLDSTTLHYSVTIGADCGRQTYVQIIEGTRQSNDNPQKLGPGYIPGPGTFSGSQVVTPLRSLTWFMYLGDPNFGDVPTPLKLPSNDHRSLGAVIEVTYPAGPLLDPAHSSLVVTGNTFTVTDNSVAQRRDFVRAVETPNAVVRVMGNVDLDLSGLDRIRLEPNVQIIGDRSLNPVGPRLFTTTEPSYLFVVPQTRSDSHERISWIRLQGGSSTDPFDNTGDEDSDGILVAKPNVEIDHNEIYLWKGAGVSVMDCDDYVDCDPQRKQMNRGNAAAVWIHDNFIHHDQHPSAGFGGGHTGGYGVETTHGAYALVERNVFDYNRHSISSGGQVGTGYLFYRNLILPNGGVHAHLVATHAIDVHGSNGSALESGHAGEYFDVEYNTVW